MNLGHIQAELAASLAAQAPNAPAMGQDTARPTKGREKRENDPHGRMSVEDALRADVVALCRAGALDSPVTERTAVERWAADRCLGLRTAWALWVSFAAQSGAHTSPFFALTRAGGSL